MNEQTDKQTLAIGAVLTPALFEDFRQRLVHHCRGEGVRDHCTADAIFIVQAKRLVYGFGPDYTDNRVVIHEDRKHFSPQEYWDDLNEEERAELNEAAVLNTAVDFLELYEDDQWEVLGELEDHTVTGWDSRWEYVNVHFTREAAEAFIKRKAHDYPLGLRIYVDAQTYCWEWNTIKAAIMDGRLGLVNEPPAEQPEVQRLREALTQLLSYAERQICAHDNTHRGGAIWEICDDCGAKWADDEGGKPEFKWPNEIEAARAALATRAAQEVEK